MLLVLLWVSFSFVLSKNITPEENVYLKNHCGAHVLDISTRRARSIGGKKANKNEFPWITAYYINRLTYRLYGKGISTSGCSGVQISKRHVLTAAHCVVKLTKSCEEKSRSKDRYAVDQNNSIQILIGSGCTNPESCPHNLTTYSVTSITVHEDYNPCEKANDVALFDISPDISPLHGSPICMPKSNDMLHDRLTAVGFGIDPETRHEETGPLSFLRSVNLTRMKRKAYKPKRIVTIEKRKGICSGDSGGPLTQVNDGKYIVEGTAMGTKVACEEKADTRISIFADIREYIDWICLNTGICSLKN